MKQFNKWLDNLSMEDINWLAAIFLSTTLGTMLSALVMKLGLELYSGESWFVRLGVSLAATAVYAGIVVLIFYWLFPKSRPVFKRLLTRRHDQ